MEQRTCKRCNETSSIESFRPHHYTCRDCSRHMAREWKAKNRERTLQCSRDWRAKNKEVVCAYNHNYFQENRDKIQQRSTAYHKMRYQSDVNFKLAKNLRNRFCKVLKHNRTDDSSIDILGCTLDFFKAWLEHQFDYDMNFDNHGKLWHLDHVVPVSKFNLNDESEIRKCFHWTNYKPLLAEENLKKSNRITLEQIEAHEKQLQAFIRIHHDNHANMYTIVHIDRFTYINT